jgi:ABC-2 type transport system ATP-binding protein
MMNAGNNVAIQVAGLTRRFDALTAVDRLDLEIAAGEIFGLVGPDGAGKTTTLRLLCGLVHPSEGTIRVAGFDVCKDLDQVKDRVGYMAQRFALYGDLTVDENMRFYAELFGLPAGERQALVPRLLEMTRMEPFRARPAGQLSGGMKQKLALMCTLLHHPQVLLLDEPTNGVDPVSRRDFWAILYQLVKEGMTVLIATAYLDEAERCNRVGLLHKGRLISCDAPEELKTVITEPCFEVQCEAPRQARLVLDAQPEVLSVEPAGSSLHLFLRSPQASPEALEQVLRQHGIGAVSLKPIQPSLEDVFIAMIRKQEGKG